LRADNKKVYTLELIMIAILSFALFVANTFSKITISILLLVFVLISSLCIKKRNIKSIDSKKVTIFLLIFAIIYLVAFYLMGLYFGYYKANIVFSLQTIINYIIPITIIIVSTELIRNVFLAQKSKFSKVLLFIIMVLIDLVIYVDIYDINYYNAFIEVLGFIFFASIACNLLYNYIVSRYGISGVIIYRLITTLYIYILPYMPNVYVFFRSILRMVYPYIIYQVLEYTFSTRKMVVASEDKRKSVIGKLTFGIIIICIAMLISCQFKYGLLVIGSGSMTGAINKGDIIIFEKYDKQEVLDNNQIVIYGDEKSSIIHRIINVKNVNGETRYTTKGDANQEADEGYILKDDIKGVYKLKIPYVGYLSLWMRDIFSK